MIENREALVGEEREVLQGGFSSIPLTKDEILIRNRGRNGSRMREARLRVRTRGRTKKIFKC